MARSGVEVVLLVACACWLMVFQRTEGGFSSSQSKSKTERLQPLQLSEMCLGCICEATSNCTINIGCPKEGLCGPFLISAPYWAQAGTPVLRGDHPYRLGAYYDCVTDPYCASKTVRGYIDNYAQDCNRDGIVDCDDYARIHYMGGFQCEADMERFNYYKVFKRCLDSVQQLNG